LAVFAEGQGLDVLEEDFVRGAREGGCGEEGEEQEKAALCGILHRDGSMTVGMMEMAEAG
jgi:hypothetical protein